jgi:hypothetical protein
MTKQFLTLQGLITLKNQLINFFASATEVAEVEENTITYVTEIDYESTLAFDTTEIITDANDDIVLEQNEYLLLTMLDEILVNTNDEYIIIEKG